MSNPASREEKSEKKEYLIHPTLTSEGLHKDKLTSLLHTERKQPSQLRDTFSSCLEGQAQRAALVKV